MENDLLISVIVPTKDDEEILENFLRAVHSVVSGKYRYFEILVIDDGSVDGTKSLMSRLVKEISDVRYIRLTRSFGVDMAIAAGMESAIGDYITVILPGFDPPELIPKFLEIALKESVVVIGRCESDHALLHRLARRDFFKWLKKFAQYNIEPNATYFQAFSRAHVNSINKIRDSFRHPRTLFGMIGFDFICIDYVLGTHPRKRWGRGFLESIDLAIDLVIASTVRPLRWISFFGLALSTVNFGYFAYNGMIAFINNNTHPEFSSISMQIALTLLILTLVLAAIAEYLGRVLIETRHRPTYFVREEIHSPSMAYALADKRNTVNSSSFEA